MDGPSRAAAALPSGPAAATTTVAHVPPLAHPALDALDVVDKYRKPLAEWWHAHEEWRRAFPPASLDDLVRPQTAPTLGHEKISNPTPEQRLAYAEADKARKQAHALWKEHNAPRKKGVRKAYDDQRERVRPADDGARATTPNIVDIERTYEEAFSQWQPAESSAGRPRRRRKRRVRVAMMRRATRARKDDDPGAEMDAEEAAVNAQLTGASNAEELAEAQIERMIASCEDPSIGIA